MRVGAAIWALAAPSCAKDPVYGMTTGTGGTTGTTAVDSGLPTSFRWT